MCLATEERDLTDLSTDLFAIEGKETLALKLKLCCGIEPLKDDQLPQKICQICLEQLTTAWELRERCLATHALLRKVGTNVEDSQDIPIRDSDQESEQSLVEEYLEEYLEEAAPKASVQKPAACDLTCIFCEEVFETRFKKTSHCEFWRRMNSVLSNLAFPFQTEPITLPNLSAKAATRRNSQ